MLFSPSNKLIRFSLTISLFESDNQFSYHLIAGEGKYEANNTIFLFDPHRSFSATVDLRAFSEIKETFNALKAYLDRMLAIHRFIVITDLSMIVASEVVPAINKQLYYLSNNETVAQINITLAEVISYLKHHARTCTCIMS